MTSDVTGSVCRLGEKGWLRSRVVDRVCLMSDCRDGDKGHQGCGLKKVAQEKSGRPPSPL